MTDVLERVYFDAPDQLNDDGTVTVRVIPSNWHAYNVSPDTYQTFTTDSYEESTLDWIREETGRELSWDDLDWTYDNAGIVHDLAEVLAEWIRDQLWDIGLESIDNVRVIDTWSPQYYNFTSDGFEMEFTCDPAELRELTPYFDVYAYGNDVYASYDGFASYVPGRLHEADWRAQYDGEFRVESLLAAHDPHHERGWMYAAWEALDEICMERVGYTVPSAWGEECREMDEYARTFTHIDGQLDITGKVRGDTE